MNRSLARNRHPSHPRLNDSPDELRRLTEFLAGISPDIPWHVTAFHGDYKMQNDVARDTTADEPSPAVEIGRQSGLRYIYAAISPARSAPGKTLAVRTATKR